MKKSMIFLVAMSLAIAGFAQASWTLSPANGTRFYSDDAAYNGMISATYYEAAPATTFHAPATRGEHGGGTTGIESEKMEVNPIVNIYSAQGILLKKNIPASTVNSLGKGLYIVDGKKVLVK